MQYIRKLYGEPVVGLINGPQNMPRPDLDWTVDSVVIPWASVRATPFCTAHAPCSHSASTSCDSFALPQLHR